MAIVGIADVAVYIPTFALAPDLSEALGSPVHTPLSAPDEDALTMLWEVFDCMGPASGDESMLVAGCPPDLEPRAVVAHLIASGAVVRPSNLISASAHTGPAGILATLKDLGRPAIAGIVDRARESPIAPPNPEMSIALRIGDPSVAKVASCATRPSLTFDRWADLRNGAADDRFVEEALQTEAKALLDELVKDVGLSTHELAAVVVSSSHRLRTAVLAERWGVRTVVQPRATPHGAAAVLHEAFGQLADAGDGQAVAVLDLGWGATGAVLVAGSDIARAARRTTRRATGIYNYREWAVATSDAEAKGPWTSPQELWRDAPLLLGRRGYRCLACGSIGFPFSEVCELCGEETAITELARTGTVVTHTTDRLYEQSDAIQMVVLDVDGGGRFYAQAAKDSGPMLEVGDRARLVLRLLHRSGGLPHYFWKVKHDVDG